MQSKQQQDINRQISNQIFQNIKFKITGYNKINPMLKDQSIIGTNGVSSSSLPKECQQFFKQLNCPAHRVNQLISGVKLAKLINKILFDNSNLVLSNQIITQNEQRKGNNVINMNMILKQVKNNPTFQCPQHIADLTTFKLIDSEDQMLNFVKWLMDCAKKQSKQNAGVKKFKQMKTQNQYIQQGKQNILKNSGNYIRYDSEYRIKQMNKAPLNTQEEYYNIQDQNLPNQYQVQKKQQNIFENVYFCDRDLSPEKGNILNDSLQLSDKVSKKGSFKVVRPKTIFTDSQNDKQSDSKKDSVSPSKYQMMDNNKGKLNNNTSQQYQRYYSDQKQSSSRKTIPKMHERPPIYRKLNRQQTKAQSTTKNNGHQNVKQPKPFIAETNELKNKTSNSKFSSQKQNTYENLNVIPHSNSMEKKNRTKDIFNQIKNIQQQISKQKFQMLKQSKVSNSKSHSIIQNSDVSIKSVMNPSRNKSSRKIFKVDIREVNQNERKSIVQWLISINLLNSMATNYFNRFHEICKNGVIFPEIINHHKGRAGQLYYFKNPIKSAQVHSNYQKVFSYLKQLPNFSSQLLFLYDYFVPQVLQNAFWSLLKSCQQAFQRNLPPKSKTYTRDTSIKQKLKIKQQSQFSSRIKSEKEQSTSSISKKLGSQDQYKKIKFGSTSKLKQSIVKSLESKNQIPKSQSNQKNQKKEEKGRKSSLDFIKQLPQKQMDRLYHQQLKQIQQPVQLSKVNKGYKQLHELKKSHNNSSFINTPKKADPINRSRIVSTNSIKKSLEKPQIPSISLQMEMKVLKYLKQQGHLNLKAMESLPLFQDNIRNGVLFNIIIKQQLKVSYKFIQKPRNIIDCRHNFQQGFTQLRQLFVLIPSSYQFYCQQIIKGEMTIFYGLVWYIINANLNKGSITLNKGFKNESAILNISKNSHNFEMNPNQSVLEQILFWFRELQQQNSHIAQMHIRDINGVMSHITNNNLLYKIALSILPQKYTLKPTYEQPINQMQQQSNVKKILSFYSHNKVLRSDFAWKAKSIVKKQKNTILQVLKQLMSYNKNAKKSTIPDNTHAENPVISFVKFTRQNSKQQIKNNQRANQRLQTTMANNSFSGIGKKQIHNKQQRQQIQPIQVPWMRSLGFTQDLSLNNGVILCRLITKLTMQSLIFNENPISKAECLTNIRKALRLIDKFKWDQQDVVSADEKTTLQMYRFIKQKYKHSYALKTL